MKLVAKYQVLAIILLVACYSSTGSAAGFTVKDIEIEGIRRVDAGKIFTILPFRIGDYFDFTQSPKLIALLYQQGYFEEIELRYDNDRLRIVVQERPGIANIVIEGAEKIPDDGVLEILKSIGIEIGQVYNDAASEQARRGLESQYHALGNYAAKIAMEASPLPDNQISLHIKVDEDETARIRKVTINGNRYISDKRLKKKFQSGPKSWYQFWSKKDNYSKFKLSADIESLRSTYYDYGYLDFKVEETKVTLTPDRRFIDILIKINEGKPYRINTANLAGGAVPARRLLKQSIDKNIKQSDVFSRKDALIVSAEMGAILKNQGYAFATVDAIPETDQKTHTVNLNFFPNPGKRTYVRRINIRGNTTTDDEVFRQQLRQLEGAPYSAERIELSKRRLSRLPFISTVEVEEQSLALYPDQIDLNFKVKERQSGSFNIGAGYSDSEGAVLSFQLNQDNFLGSGNRVNLAFSNSKSNTRYAIRFTDPYYTIDGISRSWLASYRSTDYAERDISEVDTEELAFALNYGIPISESDTLGLGISWENVRYAPGGLAENGSISSAMLRGRQRNIEDLRECLGREGETYDYYEFTNYSIYSSLRYDTRDRGLFTTEGADIRGSLEVYGPGSGLKYYRASYAHRHFFPLSEDRRFVFAPRLLLSYAEAYSNTPEVPCTNRFFAGGTKTVRGYLNNSLGPRNNSGDPEGGNFRLIGNFDLYFPTAFLYDPARLRASIFTDIGNVYEDIGDFDSSELKGSLGLNVSWVTAIGAVTFNIATHYNDDEDDTTESFQFDLGTNF